MNINDLTIGQAKELAHLFGCGQPAGSRKPEQLPFGLGDTILIRTVTMIQVGTVVQITPNFIQLENAGWVADTGRFHECLANGTMAEFERAPSWVLVGRGAIVDVYPWQHNVLESSK